jgi:transcriptional regulator with XRE-family HTH domain
MIKIGEKIKKVRELKNYTQEYMAKRLNITQAGYSKMECGETDITYSKIEEICLVLQISAEDLISFDHQKMFNSVNNVKGDNNGITIMELPKEIKKLYEDKIFLLEKLLKSTEHKLKNYEDKFGDI